MGPDNGRCDTFHQGVQALLDEAKVGDVEENVPQTQCLTGAVKVAGVEAAKGEAVCVW